MPGLAEGGALTVAWGKQIADELAAQEAAKVAQERAATTARMTPWEQQMLVVLGEMRDALLLIAPPPQHPQRYPAPAADHPDT